MVGSQVILLGLFCAFVRGQHQGNSADIFRAYSPGQYAHEGANVYRTVPRIVAASTNKNGQPIIRAVKKVRISQVRPAIEQPITFSQTVPAVSSYRSQPQPIYYVQQPTLSQSQLHLQPQNLPLALAPKLSSGKQSGLVRNAGPALQQVTQEEEEPEDYASDPNPSYNFSFDVKDDELTNYQNRQEERNQGVIKGSYSVVDPDGYVRTVTYTADSKNGFQAKVVREPTDVKVKFPAPTEAPERVMNE